MERYRSGRSIEVDCIGYADIDDFETEVLVEELKRRKYENTPDDLLLVHEALVENRVDDARLLLERFLWPKFKSLNSCMAAFISLKAAP